MTHNHGLTHAMSRLKNLMMLCALVLMMTASAVSQNQVEIVNRNPDGSVRIKIDGVAYLAITGKQSDDWQILQNNYDKAVKDVADLNVMVKERTLESDLAIAQKALVQQKADSFEVDFKRSQEDARRNFSLYMSERDLRVEAQQFIPHGKVGGFGGKVLNFLDSSYAQAFWKMAVPSYQMIRCR